MPYRRGPRGAAVLSSLAILSSVFVMSSLAVLSSLVACVHATVPVRLAQETKISVALLRDRRDALETAPVPDEVRSQLDARLAERNLIDDPFGDEAGLSPVRNTRQRLAAMASHSNDPILLLVETKVVFFEVLQGRYRWVVYAKLSAAHPKQLDAAAVREEEIPVFLDYEHEKEDAALVAASHTLADKAGQLLDGFLAAP